MSVSVTAPENGGMYIIGAKYGESGQLENVALKHIDDAVLGEVYSVELDGIYGGSSIYIWYDNQRPLCEKIKYNGVEPSYTPNPEATPTPTPDIEATPAATPMPTLSPLDDEVISAFRYMYDTTFGGYNTEGDNQAAITASEDGIINTELTMNNADYKSLFSIF